MDRIQLMHVWFLISARSFRFVNHKYWLFWDYLKKNPSETWTHPPTSIVISDFFEFFLCKSPLLATASAFVLMKVLELVVIGSSSSSYVACSPYIILDSGDRIATQTSGMVLQPLITHNKWY